MLIIRIRLSKRSHLRRCMHLSFVLKSKLGNLSRIKRGRIQLKFYVLNYKFASLLFSFHSHSSGVLEVQLGVTCFWGVLHHKLALKMFLVITTTSQHLHSRNLTKYPMVREMGKFFFSLKETSKKKIHCRRRDTNREPSGLNVTSCRE